MAGVSRGAVSNWRRRSGTFPEPVAGTSSKPLFSLQQVTDWLERHAGRTGNEALLTADHADSQMEVWAALNADRDRLSAAVATDLVLSLAIAFKRGSTVGEIERSDDVTRETAARVADALDRLDVDQLGAAADFVLARLARSQGKMGAEFGFIGSRTTSLLANLASAAAGGALYDPACGIGAALLEAVARGAQPDRIVGHDIDSDVLRIAAQRAELRDVNLELVATDVLSGDVDPALRAEVIIAEPPFGLRHEIPDRLTDSRFVFGIPPRNSADTAWLQHAIAHLAESGRAYVLTTTGTLARSGADGKIRAELLRRGCVEAVIGLPGKLLPHTSIPLALWVLRRPLVGKSSESILLIDASQVVAPEDLAATWLGDRDSLEQVPHAEVDVTAILADDSVLTPQRWIGTSERNSEEVRAEYRSAWATIKGESAELNAALALAERHPKFSRARVATIRELVEQDVLDVRAGRPTQTYDDAPRELQARIVHARDVRDGTLVEPTEGIGFDNHPELTHPGDVLVTTMNVVRTVVDDSGGHLPSTGMHRLRVLDQAVLSPAYLAAVLTGSWNERFQDGSTIQRASIRELEVPVLPRAEQDHVVQTSKLLRLLTAHATRLAIGARAADTALLDALRFTTSLTAGDSTADETPPIEPFPIDETK